jgi:hypothetical protein
LSAGQIRAVGAILPGRKIGVNIGGREYTIRLLEWENWGGGKRGNGNWGRWIIEWCQLWWIDWIIKWWRNVFKFNRFL